MTDGFKHCVAFVNKVVFLLKNRDNYEDLTKEPTERVHHSTLSVVALHGDL
jgi:hypothetical protein